MKKVMLWFGLLALACSGKSEPPNPYEYFNLAVGNWWRYDVDRGYDLDTASWSLDSVEKTYHETLNITEEAGGIYTWIITRDDTTLEDTMQAFIRNDTLMLAFTKTYAVTDTFTISDTVPYAPCPLVVGDEWSGPERLAVVADVDGDSATDSVFYYIKGKVELEETLSLTPGSFDAFKLIYEHHFRVVSSLYGVVNTTLFQRIWWCPNTGPVRWVDKEYRGASDPVSAPYLIKNLSDMGGG